jgi:hypothetical protein
MMRGFILFALSCVVSAAAPAQEPSEEPPEISLADVQQDLAQDAPQAPLPAGRVTPLNPFRLFGESSSRPDAPTPKDDDHEKTPCPAGTNRPCALLGGVRYIPDLGHMTEHDKTIWKGLRNPFILSAATALVGTTVLDVEGTQACLRAGTCREGNPLYGSRPGRARSYSIAMSINAVGILSMAAMKKRGEGNLAFGVAGLISTLHTYFGLRGFSAAHERRLH